MSRFGCFKVITTCGSCGQAAPINGPFSEISCGSCHKTIRIPPDTLVEFFNDFENELPNLDPGEGMSGTVMSGAGTFKYTYSSLRPRCAGCGTSLPEFDIDTDRSVSCEKCGSSVEVYPAPKWIAELVPSAVQCISPERETADIRQPRVEPDEKSVTPVVMSCPQCGGTLTITGESDRILSCTYCTVDVYIPDAVWTRLHPVRETAEWFIRFEGKTAAQLSAERKRKDEKDEKAALKRWKPKRKAARKTSWIKYLFIGFSALIILLIGLSAVLSTMGYSQEEVNGIISVITKVIIFSIILFLTVAGALHMNIAYWFGTPGKCKKAMKKLAEKHGWKYDGSEHSLYMGRIDTTYRGKEFEIDPDDDYAIEVEIDDSPFYLKTEPPGYSPEGFFRFSTGNELFDNTFPIRYAKPEIVKKIDRSPEFLEKIMSPFLWLLHRWGDRLAMLKVDWSSIAVHLAPGHVERPLISVRYLKPDDIEPLLEDMITAAKAIDAIAAGKDPVLPEGYY